MRLLFLTRYGRLGASSRLRILQYIPWLESAGVEVIVSSLFSDNYVLGIQESRRELSDIVRGYAGRLMALMGSGSFDLVWLEKDALPWLPSWVEMGLLPNGLPYVLDYDDAVFHDYDHHKNSFVKALLKEKHPTLIRGASLVIAGNEYLAEFARCSGAVRVEVLPTVIDLGRYSVKPKVSVIVRPTLPCVGWIGQQATSQFLLPYKELFQRLASEGNAQFSAIGIDASAFGLPMKSILWEENTEVAHISSFDIGIMPLFDNPFERGKCGYKLIQYMACGLPVVASPIGVNAKIVEHGVNGFLVETIEQWEEALTILLQDPDLRHRMGQAGRKKVQQQYCVQVMGPRLVKLLKSMVNSR